MQFDYHAQQPDELSLVRGDVVKVYRKMADGEYNDAHVSVLHGYHIRLV